MPVCKSYCKCYGGGCTGGDDFATHVGGSSSADWCANVAPEDKPYVAECLDDNVVPLWCLDVPKAKWPYVPDCNKPGASIATKAADVSASSMPNTLLVVSIMAVNLALAWFFGMIY